jgi:hypothetical protein
MSNSVACNCRDCNEPMERIEQERWNGGIIIMFTCWNKACDLHAVTLNQEQYEKLTHSDLEGYRMVNRENRAAGRLWSADDTQPIISAFDEDVQ